MTINEVKNTAKFICNHIDPTGKPITGYYNTKEDTYYITYDAKVTSDKTEYIVSKKGTDIKDDVLFDPFSELKMINSTRK
ncbi:MAG: hypothetical protein DRG78_00960 [Epsilonproteobacteria bacterium]|nr:MAG: hypothetical protein DRG78_00960 [Campylobacterota bacterium]